MNAYCGVLKTYFFKGGLPMGSGSLTLSQCSRDVNDVIDRNLGKNGLDIDVVEYVFD